MKIEKESDEVFYTVESPVKLKKSDIEKLKKKVRKNQRCRIRICTHPAINDALHEMIIVLAQGVYVPPHRHIGKSESYHVIDGEIDILLFDDSGNVRDRIEMGSLKQARFFYFRLQECVFHTLVPRSDIVTFHETTNGPFRPALTEVAKWAPDASETDAGLRYIRMLDETYL